MNNDVKRCTQQQQKKPLFFYIMQMNFEINDEDAKTWNGSSLLELFHLSDKTIEITEEEIKDWINMDLFRSTTNTPEPVVEQSSKEEKAEWLKQLMAEIMKQPDSTPEATCELGESTESIESTESDESSGLSDLSEEDEEYEYDDCDGEEEEEDQ
jgi:hypothetical protein